MPRTRCLLSSVALTAGLVVAFTTGAGGLAPTAAADETDGRLTVTVERDVNENGVHDAGTDAPQPGIGITVSDSAGRTVEGVTDEQGTFVLDATRKLDGGRYFVVAEIPSTLSGLVPVPESPDFQAMSTSVDVSSEGQSVRMGVAVRAVPLDAPPAAAPVPKVAPVPDPEPPARVPTPRFAVGDLVWLDNDRSGQQNSGEPAGARVSVQLLNDKGDVVKSTTTSDSGRYLFDRLLPGIYSVRFARLPTGYTFATSDRGDDRTQDSDPDYTGETPPFTLGVGEENVSPATNADQVSAAYVNLTIDAGINPIRYAVADRVWLDVNRDGIQKSDEPGAAATVALLTAEGSEVATTTTDDQGRYQFTGLGAGRYRLRFTPADAHRALTSAHAGTNRATDSDANPANGLTAVFELGQNAPNLVPAADVGAPVADLAMATIGAGLVGVYSVGDTVWRDNNGDAMLDAGDVGVEGVKVELFDSSNKVVAREVTNGNGRFTFGSVPPGAYRLKFVDLPPGLVFAPQHVGGNSAVDSDADAQGLTPVFTLGDQNPADTTLDAGVTTPANVRVPAGASGAVTPRETVLSSTGGVAAGIPVAALMLVLGGAACLLIGRRRASLRRGPGLRKP